MNLLQLTNKFLLETGLSDPAATVVDAQDDVTQAVNWIITSWETIQRDRLWDFRKSEGSLSVTAGVVDYTYTAMSRETGDLIVPNSFYNSLGGIEHISYEMLREKRRSATVPSDARVTHIAIRNQTVYTYPATAGAHTIAYDYWAAVQTLEADTDIPSALPADFHMMITHMAVARYGLLAGGQEGVNLYVHHGKEFKKIYDQYLTFIDASPERATPLIKNTLIEK